MASNNSIPSGAPTSVSSCTKQRWIDLVKKQVDDGKLKGTTCSVYSIPVSNSVSEETQCVCGRRASQHSYTGKVDPKSTKPKKWVPKLAKEVPVNVFGQLTNGARFIRCSTENNALETLIAMIINNVGSNPKLIVSCYGGAEYFTMKDSLEREFMNGIGHIAATEDVWVLTTGLNSGVSKLIGQGVHRKKLLGDNKWDPVVIGMSRWGTIAEHTRKILQKQSWPYPRSLKDLDHSYTKLIGPFAESFYHKQSTRKRLQEDIASLCSCRKWTKFSSNKVANSSDTPNEMAETAQHSVQVQIETLHRPDKIFGQQEMLRDLFLWSVYAGNVDIALVLLLQLKSRIGAALIAAGIAQHLSLAGSNSQIKNKYGEHRVIYEEYATACIDACYKRNEQLACQLLLREIPLYGNITCTQVAITSQIIPTVNTHCFNQILNRQWYGSLDGTSLTT
ncbi:unnamed protein product, partial [Rotaria sp. Silwood1]